jgi:(R,R)-butanediol dehydrogenase/meso-butanediol dehydrogenase/diacetyl reductase
VLAAKKTGAEQATLIETALPPLGDADVLVRVRACGVCASDLPGWQAAVLGAETPGSWNVDNPGLTGHEVAGEIVDVGHASLGSRVGERVWIDPIAGCGSCDACVAGRQTLCPAVSVICQGFAEYVAAPSCQCHPLPDGLDYVTASLICDMVGAPYAAVQRAAVRPEESVGVWGLGPVGLGLVQAARIAGATRIVAYDVLASRRRFGERVGATAVLDPVRSDSLAALRRVTGKSGPDVVLCSVGGDAAQQAYETLRLEGRMVTLAGFPSVRGHRPKWVTGSWGCDQLYWPQIVEHVVEGRFALDGYVTHTLPLEAVEEAFRIRLHEPSKSLKVVVTPGTALRQDVGAVERRGGI